MSYLFMVFLVWISFFPEPFHQKYHLYATFFLIGMFLPVVKEYKTIFRRHDLFLFLFLIAITRGIFTAQDKAVAIKTYFDVCLTILTLYYVMRILFLPRNYKNIIVIFRSISICGCIVAFWGFLEYILAKNLIYEYIIQNPYYLIYINGDSPRPMSTQFNPAPLGSFLLVCLPFNFYLIKDKISFFRIMAILSIILTIAIIILTLSRAAFLGLAVLLLFYLWNTKRILSLMLLLIFCLVIILCSQSYVIGGFKRFGMGGILYDSKYTSALSTYRIMRLKMAVRMLKDYPIFGIGLNNYRQRFNEYYPFRNKINDLIKIADNMYLTLLAETGILGFVSFIAFVSILFKNGIKRLHELKDENGKKILLISMSGLMGLLVNMVGYELFYWHNPYALFCILCGIIAAYAF